MSPPDHPAHVGPVATTKLRAALDHGRVAVVVASHSMTSDTVDLVGSLGFDAVWLEGEHGPVTWDRVGDLSRAAELWGMTSMLRVRTLDPTLMVRGLSLGATGIVVPQVRDAAEAALAARAVRFAPAGQRGVTRGRRSYGVGPELFEQENDAVTLVVQLEDPGALDEIDAICAVEGVDVVFIAPNDLAQAMGLQGQLDHPDLVSAIDRGIARIAASGKAAGTLCRAEHLERFVGLGARLLYVSLDDWIRSGARDYRDRLDAAAG